MWTHKIKMGTKTILLVGVLILFVWGARSGARAASGLAARGMQNVENISDTIKNVGTGLG